MTDSAVPGDEVDPRAESEKSESSSRPAPPRVSASVLKITPVAVSEQSGPDQFDLPSTPLPPDDPFMAPVSGDPVQAAAEAAAVEHMQADPLRFVSFNPAQERFILSIRNPCETLTVCPFLKGNGLGGSFSLVAVWSAIMWPTQHRLFQTSPFGPERWPFARDIRLITTTASLTDTGPIQKAMGMLFPPGRWTQSRGVGKSYYSEGRSDTGFTWDILTYNQSPQECASATKGLILLSEPPPPTILSETITRLRGRGMIIIDMTQLDMGEAVEEVIDKGLVMDGQKHGDVRVTTGDAHEACAECHGGHRSHASIMAEVASWPEDEREARRKGTPLRLSGRILPQWGDANELEAFPEYHRKCWDSGRAQVVCSVDPHDRKPWFTAWGLRFPNSDLIMVGEWPNFDFYACKSSPLVWFEDYRTLILSTESEAGLHVADRVMDAEFGEAISTGTGDNLFGLLAGPCARCKQAWETQPAPVAGPDGQVPVRNCPHQLVFRKWLAYPGSVAAGHVLLRNAIGDAEKGLRPKLYALKQYCPNICRSMRKYAWKENRDSTKGRSETPQLVYKDGVDVVRGIIQTGLHEWREPTAAVELWKPPVHGGRVVAQPTIGGRRTDLYVPRQHPGGRR